MRPLNELFSPSAQKDFDFLSVFMEYTDAVISPDIFRRWSAISLLAGALERRVWVKVGVHRAYGNLFVMLVARPGVGKYIIEDVNSLWGETKSPNKDSSAFKLAPTNMTKASMIDALLAAGSSFLPPVGPPIEYHSLLIAAEEIGVLMPEYDMTYIGVLNKIWNNPPHHDETRRTGRVLTVHVPFPQLNIIAGAQPGWLSSVFPEEAWTTGLTSRMLMVYAADPPDKDIFDESGAEPQLRLTILDALSRASVLFGEYQFTPDAIDWLRKWKADGFVPVPQHSKLENYLPRRYLHLIKLSLVSGVMRKIYSPQPWIELIDVKRAFAWLMEIESLMPDIFRAMVGKSDHQVIEELHHHLTTLYLMAGSKPVHSSRLWDFLKSRVPSERIERILQAAEMSDVIQRNAGTELYAPRPRFIHRGIE